MTTTREVVTKDFTITSDDTTKQLQKCLAELSKSLRDSTADRLELTVDDVDYITPPILGLLLQVLNRPLPKAPTNNIESRWDHVCFHRCWFASDERSNRRTVVIIGQAPNYCSPDDRRLLGATLARRTTSVFLKWSREILAGLLSAPKLEMEKLYLVQDLSTLECQGLGDLVQRCSALKLLCLYIYKVEQAQVLVESIGNAVHLHELWIMRDRWISARVSPTVYDVALLLLQNSQNQLQKLYVEGIGLDDRCFMAIVETIPTSRLEVLSLPGNEIQSQGILAFASQLANIKSLKEVVLARNPWENIAHPQEYRYEECIAALLQGMRVNDSIECLGTRRLERDLEYYTHANWVRRRISCTTDPIPAGLWPLILARVGTRQWHPTWDEKERPAEYQAGAIYFLLQRSPLLSCIDSLCFLRRSPRKRKSVDRYS